MRATDEADFRTATPALVDRLPPNANIGLDMALVRYEPIPEVASSRRDVRYRQSKHRRCWYSDYQDKQIEIEASSARHMQPLPGKE